MKLRNGEQNTQLKVVFLVGTHPSCSSRYPSACLYCLWSWRGGNAGVNTSAPVSSAAARYHCSTNAGVPAAAALEVPGMRTMLCHFSSMGWDSSHPSSPPCQFSLQQPEKCSVRLVELNERRHCQDPPAAGLQLSAEPSM